MPPLAQPPSAPGRTARSPAGEPPQLVRCGDCGLGFLLSARRVRAAQARGDEPVCPTCRRRPVVDEATMERLRRWWLDRYTLDELREIGAGLL